MSVKTELRVDAYIEEAPLYARPILERLRRLVHEACPDVEEAIKWSRPAFLYQGQILCMVSAFKAHAGVHFWHPEMSAMLERELGQREEGNGPLGRLRNLEDLPDDKSMRRFFAWAVKLASTGQPARTRETHPPKPEAIVPDDLAALLKQNPVARKTFEGFSPSHRREYVEWITGAKREETRAKRLATTIEWLNEGKSHNWKYQNC